MGKKSCFWPFLDFLGNKGPFGAISNHFGRKTRFTQIFIEISRKKVYYANVLRAFSFSILKIKLWQNFSASEIYDTYFGFQKNGHVSAMQIQNF